MCVYFGNQSLDEVSPHCFTHRVTSLRCDVIPYPRINHNTKKDRKANERVKGWQEKRKDAGIGRSGRNEMIVFTTHSDHLLGQGVLEGVVP